MKIGFVNNQVQLGGAETVVDQLRAGVEHAGHATELIVADGKSYPAQVHPLYPRALSRLTHTRLHPLIESCFPRSLWTDRSFRGLAASDLDLIHLHNFHGFYASIVSLAYLAKRKPLVWTFHAFWGITGGCDHPRTCERYQEHCGQCPQLGVWPLGLVDETQKQLEAKLQFLAQEPLNIVAPSRYLAEKVAASQVGRRWQVHHIPNGVNVDRFSGRRKGSADLRRSLGLSLDPRRSIVLLVNRDFKSESKGFHMALAALHVHAQAAWQVLLIGGNSDWAASQLPPSLAPVAMGYVSSREKLALCYEVADIFLFASAAENFPCVILEALASECVVVATPTGGVREQIRSGEDGLLADEISGASLARALQPLISHADLAFRLGKEGRRRVQSEFSEERMIARHLLLYQEVCAEKDDTVAAYKRFQVVS